MKIEGVILLGNTVHLLATWTPLARIFDVMKHAGPPEQLACELKGSGSAVVTCQVEVEPVWWGSPTCQTPCTLS